MLGDFDYKGYKVIITAVSEFFSNQRAETPSQKITIVGLDKQVTLFLETTSYAEARAKVMSLIDESTL